MTKRIFAAIAIAAALMLGVAPMASAGPPSLCWNGYVWNACIQGPGWGWGQHWNPGHGWNDWNHQGKHWKWR